MTDETRTPDPEADLRQLTPGTIVIFRHYDAPNRPELGRKLARLARRSGLYFVVAGDWRLAQQLHADGLHLPQGMIRRRARFAPRGCGLPVSAAAHDEAAARRAVRAGAGAVLLSPVFATRSHPGQKPLGLLPLARVCRASRQPVLALGGIGPVHIRRLLAAGAAGIAGISGVPHLCRDPFGWRKGSSPRLALDGDMV
jgi:thiamine-phosphate pyrophosphorylase